MRRDPTDGMLTGLLLGLAFMAWLAYAVWAVRL